MFQSNRNHAILSAVGAVLLSAACVVAAVGPAATAGVPATVTALRY